jgi:geranylgeranyl diphosphate synthase type II
MDALARLERALAMALDRASPPGIPPLLGKALHHAVFPGGARVRPRLCLATAMACGADDPALAEGAAVAIELLHCASLVHDDMPCFDDAATRRGRPSVHRSYGEPLALLAGDALIVLAFQSLGHAGARAKRPERLGELLGIVGEAVGAPFGIVAGQAWECERMVDVAAYHRAKTAALFAGATRAGAAAAGGSPEAWQAVGERLGEAYQVADDLGDALAGENEMGKPVGQDEKLGRPNAVREHGIRGAVRHLESLAEAAIAAIPDCPGAGALGQLIALEARRLLPKSLPASAA